MKNNKELGMLKVFHIITERRNYSPKKNIYCCIDEKVLSESYQIRKSQDLEDSSMYNLHYVLQADLSVN